MYMLEGMDATEALLKTSLQLAVPLWALRLQERSWEEIKTRLPECSQMIAEHGDNILFRSKKRGETARAFNALAEGVAMLSFVPGGITFLGDHWEHVHPESKRSLD